ncbi:MAG: PASTA domain-containing protein [Bacteroidetes bacterium]|nr:PASTA domain-containing protein [Bacteroidota bacterium]
MSNITQKLKALAFALFQNILARTLAGLAILGLLVVWIINIVLHSQTLHGESIIVPNLKGLTEDEVKLTCQNSNLNYFIKEVEYSASAKLGAVLDQQPPAETLVKKGRTIYITINEGNVPKRKIATDLAEYKEYFRSFPQDVAYKLRNRGFKINEEEGIVYKPDLSLYVLKIEYKGDSISFETEIPEGSQLVVYAGNGRGDNDLKVPYELKGMDLELAKGFLFLGGLVTGTIKPDPTLPKDAKGPFVVYKTIPEFGEDLVPGQPINLIYTTEENYNLLYDSPHDSINPVDTTAGG